MLKPFLRSSQKSQWKENSRNTEKLIRSGLELQLLAKFKKILYMGFRATLNF